MSGYKYSQIAYLAVLNFSDKHIVMRRDKYRVTAIVDEFNLTCVTRITLYFLFQMLYKGSLKKALKETFKKKTF